MGDLTKPQRTALAMLPLPVERWEAEVNPSTRESLTRRGLVAPLGDKVVGVARRRRGVEQAMQSRWYTQVEDGRVLCTACQKHVSWNTLALGMHEKSAMHGIRVAEVLADEVKSSR